MKTQQVLVGALCLLFPSFLFLASWQSRADSPMYACPPCPPCIGECAQCSQCAQCGQCAQCALCRDCNGESLPPTPCPQAHPNLESRKVVVDAEKKNSGEQCNRRDINEAIRRLVREGLTRAKEDPHAGVNDCTVRNSCGSGCITHRFVACVERSLAQGKAITVDPGYAPVEVGLDWPNDFNMRDYVVPWGSRPSVPLPSMDAGTPDMHNWLKKGSLWEDLHRCYVRPGVLVVGIVQEEVFSPIFGNFNAKVRQYMAEGVACKYAVHIRRTDKLDMEAQFHHMQEYMQAVDRFERPNWNFQSRYGLKTGAHVCMRSDDASLRQEVKTKFWDHYSYEHGMVSDTIDGTLRHTRRGIENAFADIHILANAEYFVGTFSSQFSRVMVERMAARQLDFDIYHKSFSVDDPWYGIGWDFWDEIK